MLFANAGQTWTTANINKDVIMQVIAEMTDDTSGKTTTFTCVAETENFDSANPDEITVDSYVTTGSLGTGGPQIQPDTKPSAIKVTKDETIPSDG